MIPKSGDVLRPMGAPPARFRRCSSPIAPPHRVARPNGWMQRPGAVKGSSVGYLILDITMIMNN